MNQETLSFNEHSIFLRKWEVDHAKANLFIAHGLGEHGGRYEHLALHFNQLGYNVYAHDHQGHGLSSGTRGHIDHFQDYSTDLKKVIEVIESNGLDNHLLGHSLGGIIATGFLIRYPSMIKKSIISAPGFEKKEPPNAIKAGIGKLLANIFPKLTLWNEIEADWICKTKEVVETYKADSLVHDRVSAKFFTSFLVELDFIKKNLTTIDTPSLMLIPGSDIIINHEVSKEFFASFHSSENKLVEYPDSYHEVLNESDFKLMAYSEIENWIK